MANLTREQAIEEHRKMWNWIADKTEEHQRTFSKMDYLKSGDYTLLKFPLLNDCFCCDYTRCDCDRCPILWPNSEFPVCNVRYTNNPYMNYFHAYLNDCWKTAAYYARIIANLPERKEA